MNHVIMLSSCIHVIYAYTYAQLSLPETKVARKSTLDRNIFVVSCIDHFVFFFKWVTFFKQYRALISLMQNGRRFVLSAL